jgi:hypothetical protein
MGGADPDGNRAGEGRDPASGLSRSAADALIVGKWPSPAGFGRLSDLTYSLVRDPPCLVLSGSDPKTPDIYFPPTKTKTGWPGWPISPVARQPGRPLPQSLRMSS